MSRVGEALARMLGGSDGGATTAPGGAAVADASFERYLGEVARRERARKAAPAAVADPAIAPAIGEPAPAPEPSDAIAPPAGAAATQSAKERSGDPDVPDAPSPGFVTRAAASAPRAAENAPLPIPSGAATSDAAPLEPAPLAGTTMTAAPAPEGSASSRTALDSVPDGAMLGARIALPDSPQVRDGTLADEEAPRESRGLMREANVDESGRRPAAPLSTLAARDAARPDEVISASQEADGAPEQGIDNRAPDAADRIERSGEPSDGERSDAGRSTPRRAPIAASPASDSGTPAEPSAESAARALEPLAKPVAAPSPAGPERAPGARDGAALQPTIEATPHAALRALPEDAALLGTLSRRVAEAAGAGRRELLVRLTPPHLGHVRIRFTFDDEGGAQARVSVSDPTVHRLLDRNLSDLKVALREHGVDLRDLDLMSRGFDAPDRRDGRGADEPAPEPRAALSEPKREFHEDSGAARSLRRPDAGLIDISA